jgi:hypothetical protein
MKTTELDENWGSGRNGRQVDDESNMMYRYNPETERLGQRMIHNHEERAAHQQGYRDSHEAALRVHNIIRSKFDPKKWVQKQGLKWVEVHPFGKPTNIAENFNPEYDDEAGMADNNLETMKRAVQGLDDLIGKGDNLPEWCQEKIAISKSMLVAVWDYMASEAHGISESATAGATSAANVGVGPVYKNKKPPKTPKNKDGTAKNALDMKANLLTGGSIKRA